MAFDNQNLLDTASRNLAPRPPTSLEETFGTSFDVMSDQTSVAVRDALREEYRAYREEITEATGVSLADPFEFPTERELLGLKAEDSDVPRPPRDIKVDRFHEEVARLRERFPGLPLRTHQDITDKVGADRQKTREARESAARGESGLASGLTAFSGTIAAGILDPVVLLSLPFGAPWATGVIRTGLIEAGVGIASETVVQAGFQTARKEVGEEPDLGQAVANILTVGAAAGVLGAGIKGAAVGFRALRRRRLEAAESLEAKTPDMEAAIAVERRVLEAEEANPFSDTPHGRALHADRMEEATRALSEARVARSVADLDSQELVAAVRTVEALSEGDRAAIRTAADQAGDPFEFRDLVQSIRRPPEVEGKRLLTFLRDAGGLIEEAGELKAIGITPRTRPGLIRKRGNTLDEAGLKASEAGFFTERPTTRELLDAIREDHAGRAVQADPGAPGIREEAESLADLGEALSNAGVDVFRMRPEEARLAVQRLARGLREAEGRPPAPEPAADAKAKGAAAVEAERVEREAVDGPETDALREDQVRALYEGNEDTRIMIETDDGNLQEITVRELFEAFEREEREMVVIRACVRAA